jgi:serine/threonine-protein kinase RsbW
MSDLLKFTVPGNPEYIDIVKIAVKSAAGKCGFSLEDIDDIGMAVGEACKLTTCHGFDGWSNSYDIELTVEDECFNILVKDDHCRHEIVKGARPCMDCPNEGNLAMHVIKTLMDEVEIVREEGKKNSIRMVKNK